MCEPLNRSGPRRGGVLAAPLFWCRSPDPAIDFRFGLLFSQRSAVSYGDPRRSNAD